MLNISVKVNLAPLLAKLQGLERQVPFAIAKALSDTARDAQQAVTAELPKAFDRPNPFTMRAIGWSRATKQTLTATVFVRPKQAEYLKLEIEGGRRLPRGRGLALPGVIPRDQYGGVSRAGLRRLKARKDVFSGTVHGVAGLWQRTGRGLRLLLAYEAQAQYKPRLPFEQIVRRTVDAKFRENFRRAWAQAVATAK